MTKIYLFAAALLITGFHPQFAHGKEVKTSVSEVTIFNRGALVTRQATVNLRTGEQKFSINDLPKSIRASDVRIKFSDPRISVGQVSTSQVRSQLEDLELKKIEEKLEDLKLQVQIEQDSIKSAKLQLKYLEGLTEGVSKQSAVNNSQGNVNINGWRQTMAMVKNSSKEIFESIRSANQKITKLNEEVKQTEKEYKQRNDLASRNTGLVLSLSSPGAIKSELYIQYQQNGTSWSPTYEARLDTNTGKLRLNQIAVVQQRTSEDWNNIKLTLSTNLPNRSIRPPETESEFWTLASRQSRKQYVQSDAYGGDGALEEIVVSAAKPVEPSQNWKGNYGMTFEIPGRINVPNDLESSQRFDLLTYEFDSSIVTSIVPKKETTAYIGAKFTPVGIASLSSANVQVFVDGSFTGTTWMPELNENKEVILPMGQDPRIEVRVIDKGGKNKEGGVISKQKTQSEDLVFEIVNRRRNAAEIEVRAAVPVSKHRSLKVTVHEETTEPTEANEDDQTGLMLWRKTVSSGDTWKINYKVSMSHPSDRNLRRSY